MKILIAGGNGNLKNTSARYFNLKYEVYAPSELDVSSKEEVFDEVLAFMPDVVFFFPPVTDEKKAIENPDEAFKKNAYAAGLFAVAASSIGAATVLFSSYKVYGKNYEIAYKETDELNPETVLGKCLLEAEKQVMLNPKHFILRLGEVFDTDNGIMEALESVIGKEGILKISDDKKGSFVSAHSAALIADKLIDEGEYGIYNAALSGVGSWFSLANEIFRHLDADVKTEGVESKDLKGGAAFEICELSLKKLIKTLKTTPLDWHDELKHIIEEKLMLRQAEDALRSEEK